MSVFDLLCTQWETKEFPVDLCTVPYPEEEGVMEAPAEVLFLCVLTDKRFGHRARIELVRPYTFKKPDGLILFGWASMDGAVTRGHFENGVHDDDEVVVAWKEVPVDTDLRTLNSSHIQEVEDDN